jgi:uncharacterized 2Fe-2S/4Fe-4S cluster protein (DUF4445 family)
LFVEQNVSLLHKEFVSSGKQCLCDDTAQPSDIGIAFDIGTTTIAAVAYRLCDAQKLASCGEQNLQSTFGTDVIARISFAATDVGFQTLHQTVLIQLNKMIKQLLLEINVRFLSERRGNALLKKIVIAGNTAMESFAAGVSVQGLATFPFTSGSKFGFTVPAKKLFNEKSVVPPDAEIYFAPVVSAFVGGDTVCAMIATDFGEQTQPLFLADVGTNCEMALYNPQTGSILCTSSAAGPAFEGQTISCGMAATEGAIAAVHVERTGGNGAQSKMTPTAECKVTCSVIGGGEAKGICGTGLLSACAAFLKEKVVDENGTFADGSAEIVLAENKADAKKIVLTQKDIRNFQLAKAAVQSGLEVLMETVDTKNAKLFLAGGFGTALNSDDAKIVGMIPLSFKGTVVGVGNASLAGATLVLLSKEMREQTKKIASLAQTIDLAQDATFHSRYINALNF